jgi:hypothetical protein
MWAGEESNLRPTDYESAALTAELPARAWNLAPAADLDGRRMVGEVMVGFILGPLGEPPEAAAGTSQVTPAVNIRPAVDGRRT